MMTSCSKQPLNDLRRNLLLFSIATLFFASACGKVERIYYNSPSPSPSGALAPNNPDGLHIFPHTDDWADPSIHGKYTIDHGENTCVGCHGKNFEGEAGPSCKKCHESFPHSTSVNDGVRSEWPELLGHAKYAKEHGGAKNCGSSCHQVDFSGGYDPNNKKACANCHASFPLAHNNLDAWKNGEHGSYYLDLENRGECTEKCHRSDTPEQFKKKICSDCHEAFPESHALSSWGTNHITNRDDIESCKLCHEQDLLGNDLVPGCNSCHGESFPHARNWAQKENHGAIALANREPCRVCHGENLDGGVAEQSCNNACHSNGIYPHSATWSRRNEHGVTAKNNPERCNGCHEGGIQNPSCLSCHHQNNMNWASPVQPAHAARARQDLALCKTCHAQDLSGGASQVSCFQCHDPAEKFALHDDNWEDQHAHGVAYRKNEASCTTACHGTDLRGGISGQSCTECHAEYPHAANWQESHGARVLTRNDDFNSQAFEARCTGCHGETITHQRDKYPGHMSLEEWVDVTFVLDPTRQTSAYFKCTGCHFAYPHIQAEEVVNGQIFEIPWREAHAAAISNNWGTAEKMCGTGDGCHSARRQSSNRVNGQRIQSDYCTSLCHRR